MDINIPECDTYIDMVLCATLVLFKNILDEFGSCIKEDNPQLSEKVVKIPIMYLCKTVFFKKQYMIIKWM